MMQDNELEARFINYEKLGLLDREELRMILQQLQNRSEPPVWIIQFSMECEKALHGQTGRMEFEGMKESFFKNMRSPDDRTIHHKPIKVHPLDSSDAVEAQAKEIVRNCACIAGFIGLVPLPFADAPFIIVTQFVMLKKLCDKYRRRPGVTLALIVLSAIIGPVIFDILKRLIPFAGSIIGALTAGGLTWIIGSKVRYMLETAQDFNWENFWRAKISWK